MKGGATNTWFVVFEFIGFDVFGTEPAVDGRPARIVSLVARSIGDNTEAFTGDMVPPSWAEVEPTRDDAPVPELSTVAVTTVPSVDSFTGGIS